MLDNFKIYAQCVSQSLFKQYFSSGILVQLHIFEYVIWSHHITIFFYYLVPRSIWYRNLLSHFFQTNIISFIQFSWLKYMKWFCYSTIFHINRKLKFYHHFIIFSTLYNIIFWTNCQKINIYLLTVENRNN